MKLAFSTLGCPELTLPEIIALARAHGIEGLEIRGILGKMLPGEIPELTPEGFPQTQALLEEAGLQLIGFGSSVRLHDAASFNGNIAEGVAAIALAARCGIPYVRVFGNNLPEDEADWPATYDRVADGLMQLAADAAPQGVSVLLEVHGDYNSVETLGPILERVGLRPGFGMLWDVAHSDRVYGDDWAPFYELIRPWLQHVHIKDHRADDDYALSLPGAGTIPVPAIVRQLKLDGYDGWYSLEWERVWHPELPPLAEALPPFVEQMREGLGV